MSADLGPTWSLAGKVAVVTGAASGQGRATANLFARAGATVAIGDIDFERLCKVEEEINQLGAEKAKSFLLDCSSSSDIKRFAGEVLAHFGAVDILVNNAGIAAAAHLGSTDEEFERAWDLNMQINLAAQVRLARAFLKSLGRLGEGRIVNIASTEGVGATIFNSAYVAAKHGSVGLTKAMAVELASQGIAVNCILPGPIRTGMTEAIPERHKDTYSMRRVPMRRYGEPEEVAQLTLALCLPAMRWVNGAIIPADGGLLANNALLPAKLPWAEVSRSQAKL